VSKIDTFKSYIITYINHFSIYDYVAYAWLILLFFIALLLAIVIAKKRPVISILIVLISLTLLIGGPFVIKKYLDEYLRPTQNTTVLVKKLTFSKALVVTVEVKNISKQNYSICNTEVSVLKSGNGYIQNTINKLKPLRKQTISIEEPLDVNATKDLRVVFDNYTYEKDINVSISSVCY